MEIPKTKVLDLSALEVQNEFVLTENNLYLDGEITSEKSSEIVGYIIAANFPPVGEEKLEYINLFINSPGGCMDSTFAMISAVRASAIPVRTIALGSCASGGLMLAISGAVRLVDQYCSVMSHTLSTGFPEMAKPDDLQNWLDGVHVQKDKIIRLYKENTLLNEDIIKDKLLPGSKDVYITAEQALSYGLFDDYFTNFDTIGGVK